MSKKRIQRKYDIASIIQRGKVLIVYGPRRSGKTTLVQDYEIQFKRENPDTTTLYETGDNIRLQELYSTATTETILERIAHVSLYILDEAQNIEDIGQVLKIIVDNRPDIYIIATGSSSFDLANKTGEPLVGRREIITLLPFSLGELSSGDTHTKMQILDHNIDNFLVYGQYPQVINAQSNFEKESILAELIDGYLLKDILALENIKSSNKLLHILRLVAQYIGQPVSAHKIASEVELNYKTVDKYLELLEKTFVIKKVYPLEDKMSNSLKHKPKYYFYDLGIRNALLLNFLPVNQRIDIGHIFENYCFIERYKKVLYEREKHAEFFFYKDYNGLEIDMIEKYNGYMAFECKWSETKEFLKLEKWDVVHPNSPIHIIHKNNFDKYIL
jgi:predicted AAA+ superfamily ATPase